MKKSARKSEKEVHFELSAEPGSQVYVAGTFNHWNPTANPMKDNPDSGHYKTALKVLPGQHEYKFIINGVWCADPKCHDFVPNDLGSLNSVINV